MGILIGVCIVLFIGLLAAMKWIVDLMEGTYNLQKQNIELLEELISLKKYNSKHKKQQLND